MSALDGGWKLGRIALTGLLLWGLIGAALAQQDATPAPALEGPAPAPEADEAPAPAPEGVEVLTRGPVHEAFAEPVVFNPTPGIVVAKEPPPPVEELPPAQKPEGDDVAWIPGYWAWDDARQDFLWVSGIWRRLPPGRQWIPGYWATVEGGYQWVSGYWAPADQAEVEYLPTPPPTLETGPNVPAPGEDYFWSPGTWTWYEERYVWSPGTWVPTYPDWIWVPPTYIPTPAGCVFVPGYWDYVVADRGMLFAPVYLDPIYYVRPTFVYTPTVVINIRVFTEHLFCRPQYYHYFFGDYYASSGAGGPYQPWFAFHEARYGYDPIYTWSAATYARQDPGWSLRVRESYRERVVHEEYRPPRTFLAQQRWAQRHQEAGARHLLLARSLAQVEAGGQARALRLQQIDEARRVELGRRREALDQLRARRAELEAANRSHAAQARAAVEARRIALPRSPLASPRTAAGLRADAGGLRGEALQRRQQTLGQLQERREAAAAAARARLDQQRAAQADALQRRQDLRQQIQEQRRQQIQPAQPDLRRIVPGPDAGATPTPLGPRRDDLRGVLEQRRQQATQQQAQQAEARRNEMEQQTAARQQQLDATRLRQEALRQQQAQQAEAFRQQQARQFEALRQQRQQGQARQFEPLRQQQAEAARQQRFEALRQQQAEAARRQQFDAIRQQQAAAARQQRFDAMRQLQQRAGPGVQAGDRAARRQQLLEEIQRRRDSRLGPQP